jgi:hypothetical protein
MLAQDDFKLIAHRGLRRNDFLNAGNPNKQKPYNDCSTQERSLQKKQRLN